MSTERPHATRHNSRRLRLQFGLKTALTGFAVFGIGLCVLQHWQMWHQPLKWQTFSRARFEAHQTNGTDVLVVYYAHSKPRPLWRLDQLQLRYTLRRHGVVPMVANLRYPFNDDGFADLEGMRNALEDLGEDRPRLPLAVVYRHDSDRPTILTRFNVGDEIATRVIEEITR